VLVESEIVDGDDVRVLELAGELGFLDETQAIVRA
jgi:hypothetical protein